MLVIEDEKKCKQHVNLLNYRFHILLLHVLCVQKYQNMPFPHSKTKIHFSGGGDLTPFSARYLKIKLRY